MKYSSKLMASVFVLAITMPMVTIAGDRQGDLDLPKQQSVENAISAYWNRSRMRGARPPNMGHVNPTLSSKKLKKTRKKKRHDRNPKSSNRGRQPGQGNCNAPMIASNDADPPSTVQRNVRKQKTESFWTIERMRNAKPKSMGSLIDHSDC